MAPHRNHELALTFGAEADAYDRGRPGYPPAALDWIVSGARAGDRGVDAVDVGAGTGKFTAGLVERAASVTAVEPDDAMRARLEAVLPGVRAVAGTGERMPLADASVDLVTVAQAWHWVDVEAASREVGRVLRPGGVLALVWNVRDDSTPWVRELTRVMGSSIAEDFDTVTPPLAAPLERAEHREFAWVNPVTRAELVAMITSRSYVIAMSDSERATLFTALDELLDTHPDLAGRDRYPLPYVTRVTLARRTPA